MLAESPDDLAKCLDPARWVDVHGDAMLRFALSRVRQPDVAEDLVQDAFLSAWRGRDAYAGRSEIRTWLIGILRRKISDFYRRRGRTSSAPVPAGDDAADVDFDKCGKWIVAPRTWRAPPDRVVEDAEFRKVLATCLSALPAHLAQAFELREMSDLPAGEICELVGISAKNLSVRLHRARLQLRRCLEKNWFTSHDARR